MFNLSFQDSLIFKKNNPDHTCLSIFSKKKRAVKKERLALRKFTGLPNFSETHFETGAKEYLQFQAPELSSQFSKVFWRENLHEFQARVP